MTPKKSETLTDWTFVFPNDANPYGAMFGGKVLAIMDTIAAIAAIRYCGRTVSTAAVEAVEFRLPIVVGDRIQTCAKVVWTGRTSMLVKVDVYRDRRAGEVPAHCTTAHFTMVAFDDDRRPTTVPPLLVDSEEEKHDHQIAELIHQQAMARRQKTTENNAAN